MPVIPVLGALKEKAVNAPLLRIFRKRARPSSESRVIVLYDCENVGSSCFQSVLDIAKREGDVIGVRLYGTAMLLTKVSWRVLANEDKVETVICDGCRIGKNSSDIHIAVDAMELAYKGDVDVFVLVSADSDFSPLVRRLRMLGCKVHGVGNVDSFSSYAPECDRWTCLKMPKGPSDVCGRTMKHACSGRMLELIEECVASSADEDGWADLSEVGVKIRLSEPDFSVKDYGQGTLKDLLRATGEFDLLQCEDKCLARLRRR